MATLYPHQSRGINKALPELQRTGGFYLAWDPGMGKTLGTLVVARSLKENRVLIVGPVVAVGVWQSEIARWMPKAKIITLRDEVWDDIPQKGETIFYLTNYDQLVGKRGRKRVEKLKLLPYTTLVLDEAQYIKNPSAQRTRAIRKLAEKVKYKLLLSGTPAHSPLDWWSPFNLIAPDDSFWKRSYSSYKAEIAITAGPNGRWVIGYRPEVKARALEHMDPFIHLAKSSELELPEPITTVVPIKLSGKEAAAYAQMEQQLVVEIEGQEQMSAQIVLTKMLRLQQITAGHLQGSSAKVPSTKIEACLELLKERSHQKVVVACRFKWEIEELSRQMARLKRPCMKVDGTVTTEGRRTVVDAFQGTDKPYVLLLQYRAGGMALTLTKADAMILYSLEPSYIAYQQMLGRVYRIGTKTHVHILPLLAEGTYDADVYAALQAKATDTDLARLLVANLKRKYVGKGGPKKTAP